MPSLSVRCPRCQFLLKVDAALSGQATTCNHCGQEMLVPLARPIESVSAPPVVSPRPASGTATRPAVPITPAPRKETGSSTLVAPREPVEHKTGSGRIRVNIVMLIVGVLMLTITVLTLLRLTDGADVQP